MAKVRVEKRCGGPMHWETEGGTRRLTPMGTCDEVSVLEYDDDVDSEVMVAKIFERGRVHCDACGKQGNAMMDAMERRIQKMMDANMGYGSKLAPVSGSGKEQIF
jgi:hypothetical protein